MMIVRGPGARGKAIANYLEDDKVTMREAVGSQTMQARIKIIKRAAHNGMNEVSNPIAKSDRERERETVNTVKAWVADWEERKRSLQNAANAILCSIGSPRERATKRFAILN
jgi:DNA-binding transcriptional regulator YiaG